MENDIYVVQIIKHPKKSPTWYFDNVGKYFTVKDFGAFWRVFGSELVINKDDAVIVNHNETGNLGLGFLNVSGTVGKTPSTVSHPAHYGGADNPYEAIKVIEAWDLGFNLGNVVKYISRAGKKGDRLEDLKKAVWYLQREISSLEKKDEPHTDKSGNDGC